MVTLGKIDITWSGVLTSIAGSVGSFYVIALISGMHRQLRKVVTRERLLTLTSHPRYLLSREIIAEFVSLYFLFNAVYMAPRLRPGLYRGLYVGTAVGLLTVRLTAALFELGKFVSIATMLAATPQLIADQNDAHKKYLRSFWMFLWEIWSSALAVGIALSAY